MASGNGTEVNRSIGPVLLPRSHRPRTSNAVNRPRNFFNARTAVITEPLKTLHPKLGCRRLRVHRIVLPSCRGRWREQLRPANGY